MGFTGYSNFPIGIELFFVVIFRINVFIISSGIVNLYLFQQKASNQIHFYHYNEGAIDTKGVKGVSEILTGRSMTCYTFSAEEEEV